MSGMETIAPADQLADLVARILAMRAMRAAEGLTATSDADIDRAVAASFFLVKQIVPGGDVGDIIDFSSLFAGLREAVEEALARLNTPLATAREEAAVGTARTSDDPNRALNAAWI